MKERKYPKILDYEFNFKVEFIATDIKFQFRF